MQCAKQTNCYSFMVIQIIVYNYQFTK